MEDVIYGVMLRANTDIFVKEPPVKRIKKIECVTGLLLEEFLYKGWINARCGQL